jgi:hypothetical protein
MGAGLRITPSKSIFTDKNFTLDDIHTIGIFCSFLIRLATGIPIDFPFFFDYSVEDNIRGHGRSSVRAYRVGNQDYCPIDDSKRYKRLILLSKNLDDLLKLFIEKENENRIIRAIEFAAIGFQTSHVPTRLVNHVIFLETLFSTSRNEIAFQLASRISWYLHKKTEVEEKEETFDKVKNIYNLRSKIIHGDSPKNISIKLLHEIEDINTRVLNAILKKNHIKLFSLKKDLLDQKLKKLALGLPLD